MKQYQFKTLNQHPNFVSPPPRGHIPMQAPPQSFQSTMRPPQGYQMKIERSVITGPPKMMNGAQSFPLVQINGQPSTNISQMKKRLDMLLKQTDTLAANRNINFTTNPKDPNNYQANRAGAERSLTAQKKQLPPSITSNKQERELSINQTHRFSLNNTTIERNNITAPSQYLQNRSQTRKPSIHEINKQTSIKNRYEPYLQPTQDMSKAALKKQKEENPQKFNNTYGFQIESKQASTENFKYGFNNQSTERLPTKNSQEKQIKPSSVNYSYNYNSLNSFSGQKVNSSIDGTGYNKSTGKNYHNFNTSTVTTSIGSENSKNKQFAPQQLQLKIKELQIQITKLKTQKESLSDSKEYYRNQVSQQRKNIFNIKEEYENKITEIHKANQTMVNKYQEQIRSINSQHDEEIQKIHDNYRKEIRELKGVIEEKQRKIVTLVRQLGGTLSETQTLTQEGNHQLNKQIQRLQAELNQKDFQISELKNQINAKNENIKILNQTIKDQKQQIKEFNRFKNEIQTEKYSNFDQILMTQMKTINNLKQKIESLNQKSNELRQKLVEAERKNDSLENQIKIMELKHRSQINNINMEHGIILNAKENMIGSLNKKILTMEDKYKSAINEIKAKDEFFKQHLIGRTENMDIRQYIQNTLSKYQQSFSTSREEQLAGQLQKSLKKLELYEKYA